MWPYTLAITVFILPGPLSANSYCINTMHAGSMQSSYAYIEVDLYILVFTSSVLLSPLFIQKELVSKLLSPTSSAQNGSDLRFALSEVVGRDTSLLQAIEG